MDRLRSVILFTGDVAGMRWFYETAVGLAADVRSVDWVDFETAGATLAIHAMPDPDRRGAQLRFATSNVETRARALESQGVRFDPSGVQRYDWGRLAGARDPEDNRFTLWQPARPYTPNTGPTLSAVINCRDLAAQKRFYRDVLGFTTPIDSPWWVQVEVGEAGLGLHPRVERPGAERHHRRAITIGLAIPGLEAWVEEAASRGLEFTSPPTDRGFGTFADAVDPDGNEVSFRDVSVPAELEEQLAEPFDDEVVPHRTAIRKPVQKLGTPSARTGAGLERVAPRRAKASGNGRAGAGARRRPSATTQKVASVRGAGPGRTRQKPKRTGDEKKARVKPAVGRAKKASTQKLAVQRTAAASASKGKVPRMPARKKPRHGRAVRGRR